MYVTPKGVVEGVEKRGRRFFRRSFTRRLGGNQTPSVTTWLRQNINSSFYICHHYSYIIVNVETKLKMVYYKHHRGSPWINNLAEAERWLNIQESARLNIDKIDRPITKWVFIKFANIEVKVVFDNQLLLGTGLLPDWLRNLARGCAGPMVALDNFADNLCLWRCIAMHKGAQPDWSTQAARELAKSHFKLREAPNDGNYKMATGGGLSGYKDHSLDWDINHDDDDQEEEEVNTTQPFQPGKASTPYHGGEQVEMQTMQHEQTGLPDPSYEETPLLSGFMHPEDKKTLIERIISNLKKDFKKVNLKKLGPIGFRKKSNQNNIVQFGSRGGETKIFKADGS